MNKIATMLFFGLTGLAALGGIPEDADYICETFFHYLHGIPVESLRAYAREHGFSDDDLLERLKYISETRWDSEDPRTHLEAESAVIVTGMLKMTNAVPFLEELLYKDGEWQSCALSELQVILDYDDQFLDITEKAVVRGALSQMKLTWALCNAIRKDYEFTTRTLSDKKHEFEKIEGGTDIFARGFLATNSRYRIYRNLLEHPSGQDNFGLNAEGYDKDLCLYMKNYPRSKERLEQVALLAANTNASPELREKYAKELEKMRAIPEDELICLLDLYPPTENELAQQQKDGIATRGNVETADVETEETWASATNVPPLVSTSDGRGEGHPDYSRPVVVLASVAVGIVGALVFVRKRRRK